MCGHILVILLMYEYVSYFLNVLCHTQTFVLRQTFGVSEISTNIQPGFLIFLSHWSGWFFCFTSSLLYQGRLWLVLLLLFTSSKLWPCSLGFWYTAGSSCSLLPVLLTSSWSKHTECVSCSTFPCKNQLLFSFPLLKIYLTWPSFYKQPEVWLGLSLLPALLSFGHFSLLLEFIFPQAGTSPDLFTSLSPSHLLCEMGMHQWRTHTISGGASVGVRRRCRQ